MKQKDRLIGLFKFGLRAHMEELIQDGHLYMSPLSTFIAMEGDPLRADQDEAIDHSMPANGAQFLMEQNGKWLPIGDLTGAVRSGGQESRKVNVFCMHSVKSSRCTNPSEQIIDSRNFGFGDTFVVFTDADEFLRRVRTEISRLNLQFENATVEYVDPNSFHGAMGIYRKYSAFDYQCEYRFAILPGTGEPYSLHIGSIADIARIGDLSEINRRLRIMPPHTLMISDEN
ncbi:MAG: hypothetical protein PHY09_14990 [Desulfuromonadaceae bacterium]|nr:hypothetical protein [Desulfuromonadaceae bacterium]MDD5106569.1 hypothetical protein [Desulfuromonadaceae bacterium]